MDNNRIKTNHPWFLIDAGDVFNEHISGLQSVVDQVINTYNMGTTV